VLVVVVGGTDVEVVVVVEVVGVVVDVLEVLEVLVVGAVVEVVEVVVVMSGGSTVSVSFGSLHTPDTGALTASPLYAATHRYTPGVMGTKAVETASPVTKTGFVLVNTGGPLQVGSFGPYSRKVTVPVGLAPPVS
jgi:hypothetical protein